jgi:bacterioferritin-associated ferredoxin
MYVCVCKAVSDKRIQSLAEQGVVRLQDLSARTGLGTCCGKCVSDARRELASAAHKHRPHPYRDGYQGGALAAA